MIKWITDELGVARKGDISENISKIVDVRDIIDGTGNPESLILKKIDNAIGIVKKKYKAIVCCDHGLSRSNAIAVGVLVKHYGYTFEDATKYLFKKIRRKTMQLGILNSVRKALKIDKFSVKKRKTVLIIGARNFLNRSLTDLLKVRYDAIIANESDFDLFKSPIELDFAVKKNGVFLIIYVSEPTPYTTNKTLGNMVLALKNILDVCKENKISILYASSYAVYSGYKKTKKVTEALSFYPKDTFGEGKMLCEILLNHYKQNYGLNVCLLRFARIYGLNGGKAKFIQNFFEKTRDNIPIKVHKYKNGFPKLDLLHIKDAVNAINCAIGKNFYGTLNIGSGDAVSTFELAQKIKKICGSKSKISFQKINNYNANIIMDISKAKKIINWSPKVNINDGLIDVFSKKHEF